MLCVRPRIPFSRCLWAAAGIAAAVLVTAADAGQMREGVLPASDAPHSRDREYLLYVPDGLATDGSAPLVTILHGCRQTQEDAARLFGFQELADIHGFAVLYPFVTSFEGPRNPNCWGFWRDEHQVEGEGEPGDIRRMIGVAEAALRTDPARRYIAGLSSGAGMSVVMAVTYAEDIAAAGSVAGLPYGEDPLAVTEACFIPPITNDLDEITGDMGTAQPTAADQRRVPLMVIHSLNDCTVQHENAQALATSWITYYEAEPEPISRTDCATPTMACEQARFADASGETVVETVFYNGPGPLDGHFWPGDGEGDFANPDGPQASALLWAFFEDKRVGG